MNHELPPISDPIQSAQSKDLKEAYLSAMLGEVVYLRRNINNILEESSCRIGMTQDIIERHLNASKEALDKYIVAANAHFTKTKGELKEIAASELRDNVTQSLLDAHKQLLISNPPRMSLRNMLVSIALSGVVAAMIGIGAGLLTFQLSGASRLTPEEQQFIHDGRALEQIWPQLSTTTRQELRSALKN